MLRRRVAATHRDISVVANVQIHRYVYRLLLNVVLSLTAERKFVAKILVYVHVASHVSKVFLSFFSLLLPADKKQ
jgi:presenilin-like A22 family membrane protease